MGAGQAPLAAAIAPPLPPDHPPAPPGALPAPQLTCAGPHSRCQGPVEEGKDCGGKTGLPSSACSRILTLISC